MLLPLLSLLNLDNRTLPVLLDPDGQGTGIMIERVNNAGLNLSYYAVPCVPFYGRSRWVDTLATDTDMTKSAKIKIGLQS